ncbi:hypothetical protein PR048_005442 [Dryococelus australis]|uniref:Uncharacterized protein n=1 Tax=Dryococelus australis TaxID=614101 RepID=A0ABQ9I8C3_9NEOP|nr:hypothetical protein PR048_005442 [Dryococelus australis]
MVTNAIDKSIVSNNVAVIGEDDLVVLLTALTPAEWEMLFVKPSHGKTKTKIYSSKYLQGLGLKNNILFVHAFSRRDTSAEGLKEKLAKHTDVQDVADVFNTSTSFHNAVVEVGNRCFLKLYRAPAKETSLNLHCYHSFT